jgi:hypothetical protein
LPSPACNNSPVPDPVDLATVFAALAASACGTYDDAGTAAAAVFADTVSYVAAATSEGGLTPATTVTTGTCITMTAGELRPLLAQAADWLSAVITVGRVGAVGPLCDPAGLAREVGAVTATCVARGLTAAAYRVAPCRRGRATGLG